MQLEQLFTLQEPPRITTLPEARIEQIKAAYDRLQTSNFKPGDLVMPTRDSGINPIYKGEPHIVLMIREVGACPDDWYETHLIATVDVDGDVRMAWVGVWQVEAYAPAVKEV